MKLLLEKYKAEAVVAIVESMDERTGAITFREQV